MALGHVQQGYVDSHQHFWEMKRGGYDWLTPDLRPIFKDFIPADLRPCLSSAGISKTVLVQATETDRETDFLLELAGKTDFIAGVVGWIDIADPQASERISQLAKNSYFKGIRPMIQNKDEANWILNPAHDAALSKLTELNLSFDALVTSSHFPALRTLLNRHPNLRCVIDHGAKPNISSQEWNTWSTNIAALAKYENCYCKLSGLVTEAGINPTTDVIFPYFEHLHCHFGASKLMWGSDWPVVNLSMNYANWRELSLQLLANLSTHEKNEILANTASRFYHL